MSVAAFAGRDLGSRSLTVNYRDYRGEQRMSAKKAAELRAKGAIGRLR